jgi:hypothetical protein
VENPGKTLWRIAEKRLTSFFYQVYPQIVDNKKAPGFPRAASTSADQFFM